VDNARWLSARPSALPTPFERHLADMTRHLPPSLRQAAFSLMALAMGCQAAAACQTRAVPSDQVTAPVEGTIAQAFSCKDAEGEQLFVETRLPGLVVNGKLQATAVSFYKFTLQTNGKPNKRWQARDFVPADSRLSRSPKVDRFTAQDVDGDGVLEAFIAYSVPGQSGNPDEGKLLVFFKDRKYAVRGALALAPDGFSTRTLDPAFATLPLAVQNHALGLWDTVALPQSRQRSGGLTVSQGPQH
jgi:hypothetical protein